MKDLEVKKSLHNAFNNVNLGSGVASGVTGLAFGAISGVTGNILGMYNIQTQNLLKRAATTALSFDDGLAFNSSM